MERLVPAIEPDDYLKKAWPKRSITAKKFENYQATIELTLSKNKWRTIQSVLTIDIPSRKTHQFSNSFFVKTLINWNHPQGLVTIHVNILSMHKHKQHFTSNCPARLLLFESYFPYLKVRGKRFTVCTEIALILGTVRFTIRGGRLRYKRYDAHF